MTDVTMPGAGLPVVERPWAAMAAVIRKGRQNQRLSVRLLLERMDVQLSAPGYVRFEGGRRALPEEVIESICRALSLDLGRVARDAAAAAAAQTSQPDPAAVPPVRLRGAPLPQVPAIRVNVQQMMSGRGDWLEPVRGMLERTAADGVDGHGDLLLQEPLIRTIAQLCDRTLFQCWVGLCAFIQHDISPRHAAPLHAE